MTTETTTPNENQPAEGSPEAIAAAAALAAEAGKPPAELELSAKLTPEQEAKAAEEAAKAGTGKVEPVVYNPTGDAGLDMTLKFVGDLGYTPDHPAMAAAIKGDFSLLEAELATKGVKGYEAYIKLGQKAYTDVTTKTKERQAADKAAIEKSVGGPEAWAEMQTWAKANGDEAELKGLNAALGRGGFDAVMAATWLASNFNRSNSVSTEGAGRQVSEGKGGSAAATGALSPKAYAAEVDKARNAHRGQGFEESSAYKQLQQRRMAYRA